MNTYEIRQAPGPRARRSAGRYGFAQHRRLGSGVAANPKDALAAFIANRYPRGHKQYVEHRFEWQGLSALGDRWNADDGSLTVLRRWRAVVTLANGRRNVHDIILEAWKEA